MKNRLKVLLVAAFVCASVNARYVSLGNENAENAIRAEQISKMIGLCLDVVVYSKAGKMPHHHFPLGERLDQWKIQATKMSDKDKQALVPLAEAAVKQIFEEVVDKNPRCRRVAYTSEGLARVYCPLVGWQSDKCKNMRKEFDNACDKIWEKDKKW